MPTLVLYSFRYFDLRTRRWWKARYVCEFWEIAERYSAFQITGMPEIRNVPDSESLRFPTRPAS